MSYKSEFQANNADLQDLIDLANSLPDQVVQENLDSELATQDSLISQISTALEGKMAGGTEVITGVIEYDSSYPTTLTLSDSCIGKENVAIGVYPTSTSYVYPETSRAIVMQALILNGVVTYDIAFEYAGTAGFYMNSRGSELLWDKETATLTSTDTNLYFGTANEPHDYYYIAW